MSAVGGDSVRSRSGAPARKGFVVNGQMTKASDDFFIGWHFRVLIVGFSSFLRSSLNGRTFRWIRETKCDAEWAESLVSLLACARMHAYIIASTTYIIYVCCVPLLCLMIPGTYGCDMTESSLRVLRSTEIIQLV